MPPNNDSSGRKEKRHTFSVIAKLLCRGTKVYPKNDTDHTAKEEINNQHLHVRKSTGDKKVKKRTGRPLLLLDIDETLVHSRASMPPKTSTLRRHRRNPIGNRRGRGMPRKQLTMETTFTILFEAQNITIHSQKRPFCDTFLKTMTRKFDIGLFTASCGPYAEAIANWLDPDRNIIQFVFHRDHCIRKNDRLVKDLDFIGCDVKTTMIIDNDPSCFENQPGNGLSCKSFYGSEDDKELHKLTKVLVGIDTTCSDIRHQLASMEEESHAFCKLRRHQGSAEDISEALLYRPRVPTALDPLEVPNAPV